MTLADDKGRRETGGSSAWRRAWAATPSWGGALLALLLLMLYTAVREPSFVRPSNLVNILNQNSVVGVIAVGMTLVIILGGIDLSVGSLVAFAGGIGILVLNATVGLVGPTGAAVLAALATVGIGLGGGLVNGLLVTLGRLAPFIATLGALVAYRSAATWIANGGQFFAEGGDVFGDLGRGFDIPGTNVARRGRPLPLQVPWAVLIWFAVAAAGAILLQRTRFGRYVVAVGSNERAAIYSAVPVRTVKTLAFVLLGGLTGLAALLYAARYEAVNSANTGILMELEVIAAVVIGGTRLNGGSGSIIGSVIGVLLIGVIKNMLVMNDVTSHAHGMVMGLIIIAAVLAQQVGRK